MAAAELPARPQWERWQRTCLLAGLVGLGLCALGGVTGQLLDTEHSGSAFLAWLFSRAQFFRSYLLAYVSFLGLALGALVILMIHHLTGGQWGWALRGVATAAARTLPWLALLFLPLVLGLHDLYPWADWPADQIAGSQILSQKALYLNVPFFLGRAGAYFALWLVFGLLVLRWQERVPDVADSPEARRLRTLCGPGLVAYGLGATFAAFDWVMSLEPFWYSTIFGVMFATGQVLSGFAFGIAALLFLARPEEL